MLTVSQLMSSDPSVWGDAEEALARMSVDMNEAADGLYDRAAGPIEGFWTDANGNAAHTEVTRLAASYTILAMQLRAACSILSGAQLSLTTSRNTVVDWYQAALGMGCTVAENGAVEVGPERLVGANPTQILRWASQAQTAIQDALSDATRVDEDAARALQDAGLTDLDINDDGFVDGADIDDHRASGATLDDANQAALAEIRASMPIDGTKDEQREWWNALSPDEQRMYLNAVPLEVAGMKGVPDSVRAELSDSENLGYDRLALLQYAEDNWNNGDIDYMGNNCTNFVSQGLLEAGLDEKGTFTFQDDAWGRGTFHRIGDSPVPGSHSDSWGGANAQHDLFASSGSEHIDRSEVVPGDIAYWSQSGPGDNDPGVEHHAAIVTGVLPNGDILYTQHTGNREDQSLDARQPYGDVTEGDQSILFLRVRQTW